MTQQPDVQPTATAQAPQNPADFADKTASEAVQVEQPQHSQHRRWGRIQRLPSKVRLAINQSLRDGKVYDDILQELNITGHTHITYDNIATWFKTGYADWLRDQEHFEKLVLTTDGARLKKASRKSRKNFRELSDLEVAVLLNNAAREFNLGKLREQIDEKPDSFFRLVHAHALHERNAILRDRNEIELKKIGKKKNAEKPAQPKKGGVTREELARITKRINL